MERPNTPIRAQKVKAASATPDVCYVRVSSPLRARGCSVGASDSAWRAGPAQAALLVSERHDLRQVGVFTMALHSRTVGKHRPGGAHQGRSRRLSACRRFVSSRYHTMDSTRFGGIGSRCHGLMIPVWYHQPMAMTLRLTEDDERVLAALAKADGISRQEATIRAIHEVAQRRGHVQAVAASSARARSRYAEVLERLGR